MHELNIDDCKQALKETEQSLGQSAPALVERLDRMAYAYHSNGNYADAEECYLRAIEITRKNADELSPLLVPRLHNLAVLYRIQEKFRDAEAIYIRIIALMQTSGQTDILDLATQKNYLAGLYFAWGRTADAEILVKDSLEIYRKQLGQAHEYAAFCLMALALIYKQQGKNAEAAECFAECESQMKGAARLEYLETFQDIAHSLFFLSRENYRQGRLDDAQVLFRYALLSETWELWPYHPFVSQSLHLLADLYNAQGMLAESEHIYRKALALRQSVLGDRNATVGTTAHSLAKLLHKLKRLDEAENLYKLALSTRRHAAYPPLLAQTLSAYAELLSEKGEPQTATQLEEEAKRILDSYSPAI